MPSNGLDPEEIGREAIERVRNAGQDVTRRRVLAAAVGIAAAGAAGYGVGTAEAATPSGTIATSAQPLEKVYTDRLVLNERTSAPSVPGTYAALWYDSGAD